MAVKQANGQCLSGVRERADLAGGRLPRCRRNRGRPIDLLIARPFRTGPTDKQAGTTKNGSYRDGQEAELEGADARFFDHQAEGFSIGGERRVSGSCCFQRQVTGKLTG